MPVHLRLNDRDTTRNPFINFITALPGPRHDEALCRLQQLAAMVKPLMKHEGFHINSLEEYEWNREFAGRCWNHGEVVELVLTSSKGEWMPLQYVLYVFCHELAHIKYMNHIPKLHGALTRHLKELAIEKQKQGYFGDGMWSAGRKLDNGGFVSGLGMQQGRETLPEHVCGGAFKRKKLRNGRRRRNQSGRTKVNGKFKGPSLHSGAQTSANTRGGNRRIKLEVASGSGDSGNRVDGRDWLPLASAKNTTYKEDDNSTFRKRTQSRDAREKRANAALARFAASQSRQDSTWPTVGEERQADADAKSGSQGKLVAIFAQDGAQPSTTLQQAQLSYGKEEKRSDSATEDESECNGHESDSDSTSSEEVASDDEGCEDLVSDKRCESRFTQSSNESSERRRRRMQKYHDSQAKNEQEMEDEWNFLLTDPVADAQSDISARQAVFSTKRVLEQTVESDEEDVVFVEERPKKKLIEKTLNAEKVTSKSPIRQIWNCQICTLENDSALDRCQVCDTTRGQTVLGL